MRQTVGFLLLGLLASVPLGATPQKLKSSASSKMTAVQDPAAVAVLSQAITAMGGQPSSGPITTVQITGTATIAGDNNRTAITATIQS